MTLPTRSLAAPWPAVVSRPGAQTIPGHGARVNQPASPRARRGHHQSLQPAPARPPPPAASAHASGSPTAVGGFGLGARGPGNPAQWQLGVCGSVHVAGVSQAVLTLYTDRTSSSCVYSQQGGVGRWARRTQQGSGYTPVLTLGEGSRPPGAPEPGTPTPPPASEGSSSWPGTLSSPSPRLLPPLLLLLGVPSFRKKIPSHLTCSHLPCPSSVTPSFLLLSSRPPRGHLYQEQGLPWCFTDPCPPP